MFSQLIEGQKSNHLIIRPEQLNNKLKKRKEKKASVLDLAKM